MSCLRNIIGWIVGESTPSKSHVIFDSHLFSEENNKRPYVPVKAGEYVVAEGPDGCVLGIVEAVWAGHRMLPHTLTDPQAVGHISQYTESAGFEDIYSKGSVRWLSLLKPLLEEFKIVAPRAPIIPGSKVSKAGDEHLAKIFAQTDAGWVKLGTLVGSENVEYYINANGLTRHTAILAVTGGGKSNTVCVLAKELVGRLHATMVIFDMHGEFSNMRLNNVNVKVHKPPKLHPLIISPRELFTLAGADKAAVWQRRYLKWAWIVAAKSYQKMLAKGLGVPRNFTALVQSLMESLADEKVYAMTVKNLAGSLENEERKESKEDMEAKAVENIGKRLRPYIRNYLSDLSESNVGEIARTIAETIVKNGILPPRTIKEESLEGAMARLEDIIDLYGDIIDVTSHMDLKDAVPPGYLTVFDLSELDEEAADAIVSYYLRRLLAERKKVKTSRGRYWYPPVIVVIEEAHILVPRDDSTLTKEWAARIAREGRKFGVGLMLVSQRPKNVDPNVLSQTNNKIILRIVEPEDIYYVQSASEEMSKDIADLLPTLNPGEAIVMGKISRLPALVKITQCPPEEKPSGGDIDVVNEWLSYSREQGEKLRDLEGL